MRFNIQYVDCLDLVIKTSLGLGNWPDKFKVYSHCSHTVAFFWVENPQMIWITSEDNKR